MKIKKLFAGMAVGLAVIGLSACSNGSNKEDASSRTSANYTPKELNVQFVPSEAADKMEARAKPLEKMLSKRIHIPVHVTVSTDNNAAIEAMKSKKIDAAFLPAGSYIYAHKHHAANVLLQSLRNGIKQPNGRWTKDLVKSFRAEILVKKGSKIKSWKDLKGKKIAIHEPTSTSGYIFPVAELKKKGLDVTKKCKLVTVTGHDQSVMSVVNGDTDAAFVFEDARNGMLDDVPDIMNKVVPIYFTKAMPNDTISVLPNMSKSFQKKLAKAFIAIGKSKKGKKLIETVYHQEGYAYSKDSNFDIVREYTKLANPTK